MNLKIDTNSDPTLALCSCKIRTACTELPTELPFEPFDGNRQHFEIYLKNLFATSPFNNCSHEKLPTTTSGNMWACTRGTTLLQQQCILPRQCHFTINKKRRRSSSGTWHWVS